MAHDWERCKARAADLVLAARDTDRDPNTIATHNITDAFGHVAGAFMDIGVPEAAVAAAMRNSAEGVDLVERHNAERKALEGRPRLVLVHDQDGGAR